MNNNIHGKTLSIFVGLIMILLVSSTCIGFYLYKKEVVTRQQAEEDRDQSRESEMKLQAELKELKHQMTVVQDKNKEADDKINNLMDEMELNEGLRKELKTENAALKENLESAKKDKGRVQEELDLASKKYKEVQDLLKAEQDKSKDFQSRINSLEDAQQQAEAKVDAMRAELKPINQRSPEEQVAGEVVPPIAAKDRQKVELDKIVVNPNEGMRGRVLSVDKEAEFIVCNMGLKQNVKSGDVLSVYRGEEYLGDVRVSRVQEEMAAADLIPPFSSSRVRKNDTVVFKP